MSYKERVENLKKQIKEFPLKPGVYLMKGDSDQIIYVGKAKKLKNRVGSYFSGKKDIKTESLVKKIYKIDYIVTETEYESLILENNLIKKWNPKYNINLKDGKSYPLIKVSNHDFPRVYRTRRILNDGAKYYGPYPDVKVLDETLELIKKMFLLRRCKILKKRDKPCLYYHMKKCSAPCVGKISKDDYSKMIIKVNNLLSGRTIGLEKDIRRDIKIAAEDLRFEEAAELRDSLIALEKLKTEQKVEDFISESRDYIGFDNSSSLYVFSVIQMRAGKVLGKETFGQTYYGEKEDALEEFIMRYYTQDHISLPYRIVTPISIDTNISQFLESQQSESCDHSLLLGLPQSKRGEAIINMAKENAKMDLTRRLTAKGNIPALVDLKNILGLKTVPYRIEGFDIAQLDGHFTVASLITFKNGIPDRQNYRHFKIKSLDGGIDDYQAISEAVARRYSRLKNERKTLPDLILIDGGKGQVNAAQTVLDALELKIPLAGLAKREELIFKSGESESIDLPEGDLALRILQHVRDETHRFATGHNQKLRKTKLKLSSLENIPGIGPSRSKKLLTGFGSLESIYSASLEDISRIAGINEEVAQTVKIYLQKRDRL